MTSFIRKIADLLYSIVVVLGFKRTSVQYPGEISDDGWLDIALQTGVIQIVQKKFHRSIQLSDAGSFGRSNMYSVLFKKELAQIFGCILTAFNSAGVTNTYHFQLQ
jgi:hypothetical protein